MTSSLHVNGEVRPTLCCPPIPPPQWRLSQCQLPIPVCRHRLAAVAEGGVAAAETHDPAGPFAFDIAVDAGHPRVDLVVQQAPARRNDLAGPGGNARIGGLDLRRAAVARKADQPGYPI